MSPTTKNYSTQNANSMLRNFDLGMCVCVCARMLKFKKTLKNYEEYRKESNRVF